MVKGLLPNIDSLQGKGTIIPNACSLCIQDAESINHIFIHYPFITEMWERFLKEIGLSCWIPNRVELLLASWEIGKTSNKGCTLWNLVCPAVYWLVWFEWNKRVFEDCKESAFNVFCKANELTCFGCLNCNHLGDYSVTNTISDWGLLFCCN